VTSAAAVCSLVLGLGFGLPGAYGAWYYARHGEVWTFLGFPTYGDGHFERWGFPTSVALLVGFMAVCAAEVVVGVLLWRDATTALWLALALLPVELVSESASRCRSDRCWEWRAPRWWSPSSCPGTDWRQSPVSTANGSGYGRPRRLQRRDMIFVP